ncbi:hypothetical protein ACFO4O_04295 [Glaciecola siphonariae]|uniref:Phage protein, HK97 gp10 family n=1 Tax=Glaciecola siphonariae TaxID=521012 RepID=A0ABV9LVB0_9ALTE
MILSTTGTKELQAKINDIVKKQLPFAASVALNNTAVDVKKGVERQLQQDIDKPTPFTQKAFAIHRSSKSRLMSAVYIKPIQAAYLKPQILGGRRVAAKGKPILIPGNATRKDKHGNLPRGKIARLQSQGKIFKDGRLILEKMARKNRGLAYSAKDASYKPRFKFYERAKSTAIKVFERHLQKSLTHAIKTAR